MLRALELALAAVVLFSLVVKVRWVLACPGADTDAVGHYSIARRAVTEWRDLSIHWVWLPLWHLLGVVSYALGTGYKGLQALNVALSVASVGLLVGLLGGPGAPSERRVLALGAGAALALWPRSFAMATDAEPEALFQALTLGACLAWERRYCAVTGALLGLAALLRYEAWLLPPVFLALWARGPRDLRSALSWGLPGLAAGAWCALHGLSTGDPFGFLAVNRTWIQSALAQRPPLPGLKHDLPWLWYPVGVPWWYARGALLLCLPGLPYVLRRAPRSFVFVSLTVLGVISAVWTRRMNFGLDRHFDSVVPLYATLLAAGGAYLGVTLFDGRGVRYRVQGAVLGVALAVSSLAFGRTRALLPRLERACLGAFTHERAVAEMVRRDAPARVFCDVPAVEAFAGGPVRRYLRWRVGDVRDYNLLVEAHGVGHVLVASHPSRVAHLRATTTVLYEGPEVVLLRRDAAPGFTPSTPPSP